MVWKNMKVEKGDRGRLDAQRTRIAHRRLVSCGHVRPIFLCQVFHCVDGLRKSRLSAIPQSKGL